jgi:sulfate adenylyltransferase large subunit
MDAATGIEQFLRQNQEKELLRLSTAGSVDDGKSTLIGRLLFDSKGAYEDQIASVRKATTQQSAGPIDFALLTDGLRAEREQGITIDVAYRYFSTPRRKFIIADTPGHEQYTRNMATGASTANLAIILLDARKGVLPQSRRHAFIASLLGIPHMVIAINKMDLVEYSEAVFEQIRKDFTSFAAQLQVTDLQFIPISARDGDNVVEKSANMGWFEGPSLLHYLETVHIASDRNLKDMRFPVQYVIRPNLDFRGYAGQVASGTVKKGDAITVLPSGATSRVKSIVTRDGELSMAFPPMSVTICLEDEVDISRGDMLVHVEHRPHVSRHVDAQIVWMSERPLDRTRDYLIKHTTQKVRARVTTIRYKVDVNTLQKQASDNLQLNEIGAVVVETRKPLFVDTYRRNRVTGSFILIDPVSNETVAAGMVTGRELRETEAGAILEGLQYTSERVTADDREKRFGHRAVTVWLVGGAEAAYHLETALFRRGCHVHVLADPQHLEVLPELARVFNAAGMITICAVPEDSHVEREHARKVVGDDRFLDVDVTTWAEGPQEKASLLYRLLEEKGIFANPGSSSKSS